MPELRKDPITREWVIIAYERGKRPNHFAREAGPPLPERVDDCPFCPGNEHLTPPEIVAFREHDTSPDSPGWWVRAVPNKYPALAVEGSLGKRARGMYDVMNGVGAHEVIVETPLHNQTMATLSCKQVEDVLWAYRSRYLDLKRDPRLKHILFFRNQGRVAGASLDHPHSQLVAMPMVPREIMDEIEGTARYLGYRDRCVFCDMVEEEVGTGERMVCDNEHFIAFAPFAAKFPFETWIVPKAHSPSFAYQSTEQQVSMAAIIKEVLIRLKICLHDPPYNYSLHIPPCDDDQKDVLHWHLEILPRITIAAGFEMGTGVYINVTPPEQAAECLRAVELEEEEEEEEETAAAPPAG